MCIICVKPRASAKPNQETLTNMYNANKDGAGVMYATGGVLTIIKGLMTLADFLRACEKIPDDAPAVYHCRITTSGGTCKELTHPFKLSSNIKEQRKTYYKGAGVGVAHNGIFNEFKRKELNNDTTQFITNYLAPLDALKKATGGSIADDDVRNIINKLVEGSKLATLDNDGTLATFGSGWIESNGLLFSNSTYKGWGGNYNNSKYYYDSYYSDWTSKEFAEFCEKYKDWGLKKYELYDLYMCGACDGY